MRSIKKVGHITPSCNTVLEHVTTVIANPLAHRVSNHFARIPVGNVSLADDDRDQFTPATMVAAAQSLADAYLDAVLWNGTSACWNGTKADLEICAAITAATGLAASTSTLAQYEVFDRYGVREFGLAVPYTDDVTAKADRDVRSRRLRSGEPREPRADHRSRYGKCAVLGDQAANPSRRLAHGRVHCRRLHRAARRVVVEELEKELGKPVFDSVIVTLSKGLELVRCAEPLDGWGCLMRGEPAVRASRGAAARS